MKALELKYQVCDWAKRAYQDGLFEGTCGNLSAFDRAQGIVVITPSGVAYDRYRPEDMVVIDLEGRVLEGNYPPPPSGLCTPWSTARSRRSTR